MIEILSHDLDFVGHKHIKSWGYELWIDNNNEYCGKLLVFNKHCKFSMHYHMLKRETWFVQEGEFELKYINTETADLLSAKLVPGDIVKIPRGQPHQLICQSDGGVIFEVSTEHIDSDSYRVLKGDSQSG